MNLDEIRKQIDELDVQILELFCKRMDLVKGVAAYKIENEMPVLRPEREQAILDKVSNQAGEEYGSYAVRLFSSLMEVSRQLQHQIIKEYERSAAKEAAGVSDTEDASGAGARTPEGKYRDIQQRGQER